MNLPHSWYVSDHKLALDTSNFLGKCRIQILTGSVVKYKLWFGPSLHKTLLVARYVWRLWPISKSKTHHIYLHMLQTVEHHCSTVRRSPPRFSGPSVRRPGRKEPLRSEEWRQTCNGILQKCKCHMKWSHVMITNGNHPWDVIKHTVFATNAICRILHVWRPALFGRKLHNTCPNPDHLLRDSTSPNFLKPLQILAFKLFFSQIGFKFRNMTLLLLISSQKTTTWCHLLPNKI